MIYSQKLQHGKIMAQGFVVKMNIMEKIDSFFKVLNRPAFIIESIDEDEETKLLFFWVRFEGKSTAPIKKDPLKLFNEGKNKNAFSDEDYSWILDSMLENQKRLIEVKYRKEFTLIKHQFSNQLEEPLIVYSDISGQIHIKSAKEIYSNLDMLKKFNSEDSACIGNIVGCHETQKEIAFRNENRNNNVIKFDRSLVSG